MTEHNLKINNIDENGAKQGFWQTLRMDGSVYSKVNYVNDKRHGYFEIFYSNGTHMSSGYYANGIAVGYWEFYEPNIGEIIIKEYYL